MNDQETKKSKLWLWALLGCGGVAVLSVVAVAVLWLFLARAPGGPGVGRKGAAPSSYAMSSLKMYEVAQAMYLRTKRDKDKSASYARQLVDLYEEKDGRGRRLQLIREEMAAAHGPDGKPMAGYLFLEMKSIGGNPIDWSNDFALCALPSSYYEGRVTVIISTRGKIYMKDQGPDGTFVEDFPADPVAAGWMSF